MESKKRKKNRGRRPSKRGQGTPGDYVFGAGEIRKPHTSTGRKEKSRGAAARRLSRRIGSGADAEKWRRKKAGRGRMNHRSFFPSPPPSLIKTEVGTAPWRSSKAGKYTRTRKGGTRPSAAGRTNSNCEIGASDSRWGVMPDLRGMTRILGGRPGSKGAARRCDSANIANRRV